MEPDAAVDAYLDTLPEPERTTLTAWRACCLDLPDDFQEVFRYGMPCYVRAGETELAYAAQTRYYSPVN